MLLSCSMIPLKFVNKSKSKTSINYTNDGEVSLLLYFEMMVITYSWTKSERRWVDRD